MSATQPFDWGGWGPKWAAATLLSLWHPSLLTRDWTVFSTAEVPNHWTEIADSPLTECQNNWLCSWPLNNMGMNCTELCGSMHVQDLIKRHTVSPPCLRLWNCGYKGWWWDLRVSRMLVSGRVGAVSHRSLGTLDTQRSPTWCQGHYLTLSERSKRGEGWKQDRANSLSFQCVP